MGYISDENVQYILPKSREYTDIDTLSTAA